MAVSTLHQHTRLHTDPYMHGLKVSFLLVTLLYVEKQQPGSLPWALLVMEFSKVVGFVGFHSADQPCF